MKSILVVGTRGIPDVEGGVEKNAERMFPLIVSRGWRVCVAGRKPHMQDSEYRGVALWCAPAPGFLNAAALLYPISALFKAFRTRPDIVHLAGLGSASLLWAYRLIGCKTVVRLGADVTQPVPSRSRNLLKRWATYQLRWADSIIAVTPALAKKLRSTGIGTQVDVIGNALDRAEQFPEGMNTAASGDYILFVGQISRRKNIHGLIAAFRIFVKSHPQMQLVIVGDWGRGAGRRQVEALGDDRIVMLGSMPRSRLAPLYRGARFFVNPSIREGHSNTLLEAISLDVPVLLSDLPENRDLRLDAKHYFRPESVRSMVSALKRAHANPKVFRVKPDRFPQWEAIADQTIAVYQNLFVQESAHQTAKRKPSRI